MDAKTLLWRVGPRARTAPSSVVGARNADVGRRGFTIPDDKLTPNGGAVAIGHPFGAKGTRYVPTLAIELRERHARYGAVGVCIGSGQGVAVVLENPNAT